MATQKIRAQALKELEDRFGRVTAKQLVDAARNPKHPLHRDFEWDDKKASAKYRLLQARAIIRSVRVTVTVNRHKISSVSYVRDPSATGPGYRSIVQIKTEEEVASETLIAEMDRVAAILQRAKEIAAMLDLEAEFEASMESITLLQATVRSRARGTAEASAQ